MIATPDVPIVRDSVGRGKVFGARVRCAPRTPSGCSGAPAWALMSCPRARLRRWRMLDRRRLLRSWRWRGHTWAGWVSLTTAGLRRCCVRLGQWCTASCISNGGAAVRLC